MKCSPLLNIILQICCKRHCRRFLPASGAVCSRCCTNAQRTIIFWSRKNLQLNWKIWKYLISNLVESQWQRQWEDPAVFLSWRRPRLCSGEALAGQCCWEGWCAWFETDCVTCTAAEIKLGHQGLCLGDLRYIHVPLLCTFQDWQTQRNYFLCRC